MIAIEQKDKLVSLTVLGEFSLADFKEFEAMVLEQLSAGPVRLFMDLREMAGFTLDMVWEEIKFSRQHPGDFERIGIVTESEWVTWSAWLERLFVNAEVMVSHEVDDVRNWLAA